MPSTGSRHAVTLSAAVALTMAVQSAGGLFIKGLYRDNAWVVSAWFANDLITLLVALPATDISGRIRFGAATRWAGGILLMKSRPRGYVVAGALLIQCTITTAALIVGGPVQAAAGIPGAWGLEPLWIAMGLGCATSAALLLACLRQR